MNAVKDELGTALADRIGDLMGLVRASRELVAQVAHADQQIRSDGVRREQSAERGETDVVDELDQNIAVLRALRDGLVERLAVISTSAR